MKIIKWDPFGESLFNNDSFYHTHLSKLSFDLATDIYEDNGNLIVEMTIAAIDPNRFDISVEGDLLRVQGEREEKQELKDRDYYNKEIKRGSFERMIHLPVAVVADKVSASYDNGMLKIIMPKQQGQHTDKVKVTVAKK